MMYRIIRIIQIFFLFLAVSVLNAHMIIPHDHHQADSDLCNENSNPVSKTGENHHTGLPGHCHAFNDLPSKIANFHQSVKQIPLRDLLMAFIFVPKHGDQQLPGERIVDVFIRPVIKGLPGLSTLRAPPSLL